MRFPRRANAAQIWTDYKICMVILEVAGIVFLFATTISGFIYFVWEIVKYFIAKNENEMHRKL